MNRDDVLLAARGCGFDLHWHRDGKLDINMGQLERFAAAMYAAGIESAKADGWRQCAVGQHTSQFCGQAEKARAEGAKWKEAVLDHCVVAYSAFYEDDPKKTLDVLIDWHVKVALDPQVSSDAQALINKGAEDMRERAALACDEQADEPECQERAEYCADAIRSLPITHTNTEGEQG